jgi:DNA repair exonuclease SbcCD ATPase subunit
MLNIGSEGRINIKWTVSPYDFSKEKMNTLIAKVSKKYNIPKDHVRVVPDFILLNEKGENVSMTNDIIANIQDPAFQVSLFKEYLDINQVIDVDFNLIKKIDSEINSKIDYEVYDKYKRYTINWIRWDNFLSYGEDNFFDFSKLHGLVLLNGEPANQSGKTTFAIDLLHFLLFGKTEKSSTLEKIFNKHNQDATEVCVEGCLTVDDEDFIIKRTLSRPSSSKRTSKSKTTQKVEYYKLVGDTKEELTDYVDNQQEENSVQTNKVIKEAIGKESDFDLIICATSSNLDSLIEKKDTERGKLLSRWIGLLPLEEKDIIAREKFNSDIKPNLILNRYNRESLKQEIDAYNINIKTLKGEIKKYISENKNIDKDISSLEENRTILLSSKQVIDDSLLKIDINTLQTQINNVIEGGKVKRLQLKSIEDELKTLEEVTFSVSEYDNIIQEKSDLNVRIGVIGEKFTNTKNQIQALKTSEICPTCGRKYDDIDNSSKIAELTLLMDSLTLEGKEIRELINQKNSLIEEMKELREKYERKSVLAVKKSTIELKIEQLISEYREKQILLNEYHKNNDAIDKNNELDIKIRNTDLFLKDKRNTKETNLRFINNNENEIKRFEKSIKERIDLIEQIDYETVLLKNWKIYLDMIGKNGISKMVLRKTLPIINAHITHLLSDVCDFTVEISITDKNDVIFNLIKDGIKSDLSSGSGFEKTAAALALRAVLGNISTMPRPNFIVFDEVLGRVAKENYENMHTLYNKILENYSCIIQITHLEEVRDWHDIILTVKKEKNISKIITKK